MHLPDVRRVVQYMIPQQLVQWTQHAGKCGQDGKPSMAILFVEPSVFQEVPCKDAPHQANKVKKNSNIAVPQARNMEPNARQLNYSANTPVIAHRKPWGCTSSSPGR